MDPENQVRIRANFKLLVKNFECAEIEDYLYQEGVLDQEELESLSPERVGPTSANKHLLRLLPQKVKTPSGISAYQVFCDALLEAGFVHAIELLENTDLSKYDHESYVSTYSSEDKVRALERSLQAQMEYFHMNKDEIDSLRTALEVKDKQSQEMKEKLKELESRTTLSQDLTEEHVVAYITDYVTKKDNVDSVDSPLRGQKSLLDTYMPLIVQQWMRQEDKNVGNIIEKIARTLGRDIVQYTTCSGTPPPAPNKYAATMRKIVDEILKQNDSAFRNFIDTLDISEINGLQALENIADEMFYDKDEKPGPNWGYIVTLYAFGGYVARHCSSGEQNMSQMADFIGDFLGFYVSRKLGEKIERSGGWDAFNNYFSKNPADQSSRLYNLGRSLLALSLWVGRGFYTSPGNELQQ